MGCIGVPLPVYPYEKSPLRTIFIRCISTILLNSNLPRFARATRRGSFDGGIATRQAETRQHQMKRETADVLTFYPWDHEIVNQPEIINESSSRWRCLQDFFISAIFCFHFFLEKWSNLTIEWQKPPPKVLKVVEWYRRRWIYTPEDNASKSAPPALNDPRTLLREKFREIDEETDPDWQGVNSTWKQYGVALNGFVKVEEYDFWNVVLEGEYYAMMPLILREQKVWPTFQLSPQGD